MARSQVEGSTAIFEGVPEYFELRWNLVDAKDGTLVSATDLEMPTTSTHIVVTFRVQKAYKGELGPEVKVSTGLGGGDCGARLIPA